METIIEKYESFNGVFFDRDFLIKIINIILKSDTESKPREKYSINVKDGEYSYNIDDKNTFFKEYSKNTYKNGDISVSKGDYRIYITFDLKYGYGITISSKNKSEITFLYELIQKYYLLNKVEKKETPYIIELQNKTNYISCERIKQLESIEHPDFDLEILIQYCKEINVCHSNELLFSVILLVRGIINHIPPIFGYKTFNAMTSERPAKSIKDNFKHLEYSSRRIADRVTHEVVEKKSVLPTDVQINFSNDIDVLLGEIYKRLK